MIVDKHELDCSGCQSASGGSVEVGWLNEQGEGRTASVQCTDQRRSRPHGSGADDRMDLEL